MNYPSCVLTRDSKSLTTMCSHSSEYRFVSLLKEVINSQLGAYGSIGPYLHSQPFYPPDVSLEDIFRQTVLRDTYMKHSSSHGKRLEDGNLIPLMSQMVGAGKPCRPRSNNGNLFLLLLCLRQWRLIFDRISDESLDGPDSNGLFQECAVAFSFTRSRADPPQYPWNGEFFLDQRERLFIFAFSS